MISASYYVYILTKTQKLGRIDCGIDVRAVKNALKLHENCTKTARKRHSKLFFD